MTDTVSNRTYTSFLGTGWSFPPEFEARAAATGEPSGVVMVSDEDDIRESLEILFGTGLGERFLNPNYGLDLQSMLFEPMSTTMKTFMQDRIKTAILIYEPRINLLSLELDTSAQYDGLIRLLVGYEVRSTNSRYNLVYPFFLTDSNELRGVPGVSPV